MPLLKKKQPTKAIKKANPSAKKKKAVTTTASSIKKSPSKKVSTTNKVKSTSSKKKQQTTVDLINRSSRQLNVDTLQTTTPTAVTKSGHKQDVISFSDFEKQSNMARGSDAPGSRRSNSYVEGTRTIKDCYAPDSIKVVDERTLRVGDKYVRNFVLQGYPLFAQVYWLDSLYSYRGNLDTMIYVEPEEARQASQELTKQITQLTAQLQHDQEKGSMSNIDKYSQEIARLQEERAKVEMNAGSFYKVQIFANMFADSKAKLDKSASMLESDMQGQRMNLLPTALRMVDGYRSCLPSMRCFYEDKFRNLNSGAVAACMPFYNAEICHPGGTLFGINYSTGTPMYINMYDKHAVNNTNMSIFGRAGAGKSYFVSLLTMRSVLQNIHSAIVDPEGEYSQIALAMGGVNVEISATSDSRINLFDIEEAVEVDEDGKPTGKYSVDVNEKVSDVCKVLGVMAGGNLSSEHTSLISIIVQQLYASFGINENPKSLYSSDGSYDSKTGVFYSTGKRKQMPTISDFCDLLNKDIAENPEEFGPLRSFANTMKMFRREGAYGLFDCQSSISTNDLSSYTVINFDVHALEEGILRPIGMYITMTYIWEKFVKKNFSIRKRVICDEAWMLMNKGMAGSEYTRKFLETCSRRIRKRNAGLLVASQNFIEFANSDEGEVILSNTAVRVFLKQSDTDILSVQQKFNLSEGETDFLRNAQIGEFLIKTDTESAVGKSWASKYEHTLLTTKNPVQNRH